MKKTVTALVALCLFFKADAQNLFKDYPCDSVIFISDSVAAAHPDAIAALKGYLPILDSLSQVLGPLIEEQANIEFTLDSLKEDSIAFTTTLTAENKKGSLSVQKGFASFVKMKDSLQKTRKDLERITARNNDKIDLYKGCSYFSAIWFRKLVGPLSSEQVNKFCVNTPVFIMMPSGTRERVYDMRHYPAR